MGAGVVAAVEFSVESESPPQSESPGALQLRLLGAFTVLREGKILPLPPSRKLRALIAYLALASQTLAREHLCELLWDIPHDPRGELRWCLSKARLLVNEPGRARLESAGDGVRLHLRDCDVDAVEVARKMQQGPNALDTSGMWALLTRFEGDFLDGLEISRNPFFNNWLTAQRRRYRAYHVALLEQLVAKLPEGSAEAFRCLDAWLQLAPFDRCAHELMLQALAYRGQLKEGDEHLAATARSFEAEGLEWLPLRVAWRNAKLKSRRVFPAAPATESAPLESDHDGGVEYVRRASIAVMPFTDLTAQGGDRGGPADGLAHDIITRLAKLRSLFVIAQGTVFALDQRSVGAEEAGRALNVSYVLAGTFHRTPARMTVNVQLIETRTARIIWAEIFDRKTDDAFLALDDIGDRIVGALDVEIENVERNRAILKPPSSLNAWEAHHRGLWHMYRFNRADNEFAAHFFEMAIRLDPTFSRAYAGLSFTHWQNAFQHWGEREAESGFAYETASQALLRDARDPAAHWAMGRALWLRGEQEQSLIELQDAVDLSPNFALGHYTLGFICCQSGEAESAIISTDHSRTLSPFDPLLFGMLAVRALALARLGRFDEAAEWAVKAAARPNAHVHIQAIAAHCLAMADKLDEARGVTARIHTALPEYGVNDFLAAFRLSDDAEQLFRNAAKRILQ